MNRRERRTDMLLGLAALAVVCCGLLLLNACGCGRECPAFPIAASIR